MSRWKEFRREPVAGEWTRKQKRGYHRVRSLLWFWECHQFQVLWVTLSTAEGGDSEKLTYHHKQLRQRIERQLGFQGLEYYQVRTEEGHGGADGAPNRPFPRGISEGAAAPLVTAIPPRCDGIVPDPPEAPCPPPA